LFRTYYFEREFFGQGFDLNIVNDRWINYWYNGILFKRIRRNKTRRKIKNERYKGKKNLNQKKCFILKKKGC